MMDNIYTQHLSSMWDVELIILAIQKTVGSNKKIYITVVHMCGTKYNEEKQWFPEMSCQALKNASI